MDAKQEPATTAPHDGDGPPGATTAAEPAKTTDAEPVQATDAVPAGADEKELASPWRIAVAIGAVLVAIAAPILGTAIGISVANGGERLYVSQAVAVAIRTKIPPDDFAQVAPSVFATDTVLDPVISKLSLSQTPAQLLASGTLGAEAVEQTVAIRIVAQAPDPTRAQELANAATGSLSRTLGIYRLAELKTFPASLPSSPQPPPRTSYALLGAAGGLALVLVSAWAVWLIGKRRGWLRDRSTPEPDGVTADPR